MATFANKTRNSASWSNPTESLSGDSVVLREDGGKLLREEARNLLREVSTLAQATWANLTKN